MSDSELPEASVTPLPPDHELEKSLRNQVVNAQKNEIEYTVNSIRTASEEKLSLDKGFYKSSSEWGQRSKDIIKDQSDIPPASQSSPVKASAAETKKPAQRTKKRASPAKVPAPRKKQKTTKKGVESEESSSPLSDVDSEDVEEEPKAKPKKPPPKSQAANPKAAKREKIRDPESDANEEDEGVDETNGTAAEESRQPGIESDSELSVLLDEDPQPKKKGKQKGPSGQKQKTTKSSKPKADADIDPDQAEIKRLQGWLVKCGIRKVWGKELKPYETSKAKIKHLKDMLADAGMTGRYSVEKANQIKEARELAADIEAVQEGAERWGADEEGEGEKSDGRPARRLVRGAKNYDFLSSDGEETD
ncbi:hypothetical protein LTR10_019614 [Elasticomyces elasticus]|uniref:Transcriptional regulator n=1 Tax=Exophiala sideris TaxID=1016849 RepID=A0ABR0JG28_9EURO|nr:hypothetical protein LTR10_019614 [Elasticomyces elasticus]KAK5025810.1 hypothetical protein LTS07_008014 [Exophiala sideris]KAK5032982.1 hypothetical protein LTR13_006947 [Exophiala sideris]KAK5063467.1 hypothetical protein LTR69_004173 [Exophiala sideris]KAK5180701.1 hypothetical protein LTR44_007015 [Eurotiomycetes sp. CCFEE 6388]